MSAMIWWFTGAAVLLLMIILVVVHRSRGADRGEDERTAQLARLRQRAALLESLIVTWQTHSDNRQVARQLYLAALEQIDRIGGSGAAAAFAATEQERLLDRLADCETRAPKPLQTTALGSAREVSRVCAELREIKRTLHARCDADLISAELYQQLAGDIDQLSSSLAIGTYVKLSRDALARAQDGKAVKLLDQAQALLDAQQPAAPGTEACRQAIDTLRKELGPDSPGAQP